MAGNVRAHYSGDGGSNVADRVRALLETLGPAAAFEIGQRPYLDTEPESNNINVRNDRADCTCDPNLFWNAGLTSLPWQCSCPSEDSTGGKQRCRKKRKRKTVSISERWTTYRA
jgi:hypothetical protein